MEFNFSPYMLQGDKCQFQNDHSSTITDAGYYSASGSLSPSSSIDSGCFSPPASCWLAGRLPEASGNIHSHPAKKPRTLQPTEDKRRSRSKNPGSKRETASEREKLRMRDLTKAMHHLRTFLPPSVAPQGQTLTKIETLRLTIKYISHLSAQLECGQEISNHETTQQIFSQGTSDRLQSGSWCLDDTQEHFQDNNQYCSSFTAFTDSTQLVDANVSFSSCDGDAQSYVFPYARTHNTTDYSQAFYQ